LATRSLRQRTIGALFLVGGLVLLLIASIVTIREGWAPGSGILPTSPWEVVMGFLFAGGIVLAALGWLLGWVIGSEPDGPPRHRKDREAPEDAPLSSSKH
jgi:hypothetical protein